MKIPSKASFENEALIMGLIFVPMLVCYAIALINDEPEFLALAFGFQFLLAVLQIISSIIRIFRYGSKIRKKYLYYGFLYIFSAVFTVYFAVEMQLPNAINNILWVCSAMIIPIIFTGFYLLLTFFQSRGQYLKTDLPNSRKLEISENSDAVVEEIMLKHKQRIYR